MELIPLEAYEKALALVFWTAPGPKGDLDVPICGVLNYKVSKNYTFFDNLDIFELCFSYSISAEQAKKITPEILDTYNQKLDIGFFTSEEDIVWQRNLKYTEKVICYSRSENINNFLLMFNTLTYMKKAFSTFLKIFDEKFPGSKQSPEQTIRYLENYSKLDQVFDSYKITYENQDDFETDFDLLAYMLDVKELADIFIGPATKVDIKSKCIHFTKYEAAINVASYEAYSNILVDAANNLEKLLSGKNIFVINNEKFTKMIYFVKGYKDGIVVMPDCPLKDILDTDDPNVKSGDKNHNIPFSLSHLDSMYNYDTIKQSRHFSLTEIPIAHIQKYIEYFHEYSGCIHKNLIRLYGIACNNERKYFIVSEPFKRNSFYNRFFADYKNPGFQKFKKVLLDIWQIILYFETYKIKLPLHLSLKNMHYSNGKIKIIPSFKCIEDNYLYSPEEINDICLVYFREFFIRNSENVIDLDKIKEVLNDKEQELRRKFLKIPKLPEEIITNKSVFEFPEFEADYQDQKMNVFINLLYKKFLKLGKNYKPVPDKLSEIYRLGLLIYQTLFARDSKDIYPEYWKIAEDLFLHSNQVLGERRIPCIAQSIEVAQSEFVQVCREMMSINPKYRMDDKEIKSRLSFKD